MVAVFWAVEEEGADVTVMECEVVDVTLGCLLLVVVLLVGGVKEVVEGR